MKFKIWQNYIKNYREVGVTKTRRLLLNMLNYALNSVDPRNYLYKIVRYRGGILAVYNSEYVINTDNTYIFGFGKSVGYLAEALINILGGVAGGAIIVPKEDVNRYSFDEIEVYGASHPYPDANTLEASTKLVNYLMDTDNSAFIIFLIGGGGSSLFEIPSEHISIDELTYTYKLLVNSGLSIEEINAVRSILSKVKGGKLLRYIYPRNCIALVISDVVGDRLDVIASAPLYNITPNYTDVLSNIKKSGLLEKLPSNVAKVLAKGEYFQSYDYYVEHFIVGRNSDLLNAVKEYLASIDINAAIISSFINASVDLAVEILKPVILEEIHNNEPLKKPCVLIFGGETYSKVLGEGLGGPNQELALKLALELNHPKNASLLAVDSDGIDGNSPAAGAIADKYTFERIVKDKLDVSQYLMKSDSYTLLDRASSAIITGSTGLNVNNLMLAVIK